MDRYMRSPGTLATLLWFFAACTMIAFIHVAANASEDENGDEPSVSTAVIPSYIPKASKDVVPFSLQLKIENITTGHEYRLKAFVSAQGTNKPASQLWNGSSWVYPNSAWSTMPVVEFSDSTGCGYPVLHLRMKESYSGYDAIREKSTAEIRISLKNMSSDRKYGVDPVQVDLLDLPGEDDGDVKNGTAGVVVTGFVSPGEEPLSAAPVLFRQGNADQHEEEYGACSSLLAFTLSEDDGIDPGGVEGSYRIALPIFDNITVSFHDGSNITHAPLTEAPALVHLEGLDLNGTTVVNMGSMPHLETALIVEVYSDSYRGDGADEYVIIHNPGQESLDISGWRISDGEGTCEFPGKDATSASLDPTLIGPCCSITIARNALAYGESTGLCPDLEWQPDSESYGDDRAVPDMVRTDDGEIAFANARDEIFLFDSYGRLVDTLIYGSSGYSGDGWSAAPVPAPGEGIRLVRNLDDNPGDIAGISFVDTNTSADWESPRIHVMGQSDLPFRSFHVENGSVTVFAAPDSSFSALRGFIDSAEDTLDICVYEFVNLHLLESVRSAALRGVAVRILLEGAPVGGIPDAEKWVARELQEAGAVVRFLINDLENGIHDRYRYVHSKYAIADSIRVAIMSENWKDTAFPQVVNSAGSDGKNAGDGKTEIFNGNRGWGVIVESMEVAGYYSQLFEMDHDPAMVDSCSYNESHPIYGAPREDHSFSSSSSIHEQNGDSRPYHLNFPAEIIRGDFVITPVVAPDHTFRNDSIIGLLRCAGESVIVEQLQCPLAWDGNLPNLYLEECIEAARRGCSVRILLDSRYVDEWDDKSDNMDTVRYINDIALAEGMDNLEARLIYLANLSKLHNKGVVVDSRVVLVSSINWGPGAVLHNREVGVMIDNEDAAGYYENIFELDWNMGPLSGGNGNGNKSTDDDNDMPGFPAENAMLLIVLAAALARKKGSFGKRSRSRMKME